MQFVSQDHRNRELSVGQQFRDAPIAQESVELEKAGQFDFVEPSVATHRVDERLLEHHCPFDVLIDDFFLERDLFQCVHHLGHLHRLGTACRAG